LIPRFYAFWGVPYDFNRAARAGRLESYGVRRTNFIRAAWLGWIEIGRVLA